MPRYSPILLALLSGCGGQPAGVGMDPPKTPTAVAWNPKVPRDVSFPTIKDEHDKFPANKRRMVDIRLNKKVTEDVLREIALEVKNGVPEQYERTMILYYLPEEIPGVGYTAWAMTHFMPTLDVEILGLSIGQEAELRGAQVETAGPKIGSWILDIQFGGHLAVIYDDNGPKVAMVFPGGSRSDSPMSELPSATGRRFRVNTSTDTYEIEASGTLRLVAADGRAIAGALPLK